MEEETEVMFAEGAECRHGSFLEWDGSGETPEASTVTLFWICPPT